MLLCPNFASLVTCGKLSWKSRGKWALTCFGEHVSCVRSIVHSKGDEFLNFSSVDYIHEQGKRCTSLNDSSVTTC